MRISKFPPFFLCWPWISPVLIMLLLQFCHTVGFNSTYYQIFWQQIFERRTASSYTSCSCNIFWQLLQIKIDFVVPHDLLQNAQWPRPIFTCMHSAVHEIVCVTDWDSFAVISSVWMWAAVAWWHANGPLVDQWNDWWSGVIVSYFVVVRNSVSGW